MGQGWAGGRGGAGGDWAVKPSCMIIGTDTPQAASASLSLRSLQSPVSATVGYIIASPSRAFPSGRDPERTIICHFSRLWRNELRQSRKEAQASRLCFETREAIVD